MSFEGSINKKHLYLHLIRLVGNTDQNSKVHFCKSRKMESGGNFFLCQLLQDWQINSCVHCLFEFQFAFRKFVCQFCNFSSHSMEIDKLNWIKARKMKPLWIYNGVYFYPSAHNSKTRLSFKNIHNPLSFWQKRMKMLFSVLFNRNYSKLCARLQRIKRFCIIKCNKIVV